MDNVTTSCFFFENSPKRPRFTLECEQQLYEEFYESLENKDNEKWTKGRDTKTTAERLFTATRSFEHILSFSAVFNALEPIKPLVTKLQKLNQDIYTAYQMIGSVLRELKNYRDDIYNEFQHWYDFAVRICKNVGIEPGLPRLAKCWSKYRPSVENDGIISHYKRTVAIPFLDDINFQLSQRLNDQNHVETFTLLPSKMFSESYSIEETAKYLQAKYQSEMTNDGCHFRSELERWYNFWKDKVEHQQDQPDSITETLEFANLVFFPNIRRLLLIGAVLSIGSAKLRELRLEYGG